MMNEKSPWAKIATPSQSYNVRKIPDTKGVTLFWGKDTSEYCLFIVELTGEHTELYKRSYVNIQGIKSDLRTATDGQRLIISLERHLDQDIFFAMCQILIDALKDISDSAVALSVTLRQLVRWKAFMASSRRGILSSEQVRGLFAELIFFRALINRPNVEATEAIDAWAGPENLHQDFIWNNTAIEIKSISGRERNSMRISSEDQLDTLNDKLYIKLYRLTEMPDSDEAISLNDLVHEIEKASPGAEFLDTFWDKLAQVGYAELKEYEIPKLIVSGERTYWVRDDFPKIVRANLPAGISKVRYDIELEAIEDYQVDHDIVWEK